VIRDPVEYPVIRAADRSDAPVGDPVPAIPRRAGHDGIYLAHVAFRVEHPSVGADNGIVARLAVNAVYGAEVAVHGKGALAEFFRCQPAVAVYVLAADRTGEIAGRLHGGGLRIAVHAVQSPGKLDDDRPGMRLVRSMLPCVHP
jgi:hypothetical protein